MDLPNVYGYYGQHSVTFVVDGVIRNTWEDWGLIPSSRHSEPVNEIWSHETDIFGINGQEDLVRAFPNIVANSTPNMRTSLRTDNRDSILTTSGYDIFNPSSGSLTFTIADQTVSFFKKEEEILNYLHDKEALMIFEDDPEKIYSVRTTVNSFSSAAKYSTLSIDYAVIYETEEGV